jgi:DNA-binding SARP family transcriptional activator/class 3 adenylate cyclase
MPVHESQIGFGMLGPLEIRVGDKPAPLGGARQRALLARLLIDANRTVPGERLLEDVWAGEPSGKPLQMAILRCRQSFGDCASRIHTRPAGYELEVLDGELDSESFERLIEQGTRAYAAGDADRASVCASQAVSLWRGPPLRDLVGYDWAVREAERLEELRLSALELRVDANLALGESNSLIPELQSLAAAHPDRERMRGQLMLAFYRAGRQSEALAAFMEARQFLVDEYGLEPGAELQALHDAILRHEPSLLADAGAAHGRPARAATADPDGSAGEQPAVELERTVVRKDIPSAFLVWRDASGSQVIVGLGDVDRATIGRRPGNTVVMTGDDEISRVHVDLELIGGGWAAADDGLSRNGTYVNGVKVATRQRLRDGDVLLIGRTTVQYRCPSDGSTVASKKLEELLAGAETDRDEDRVLATVLFTDIVGSTSFASQLGDRSWRERLDGHDEVVRRDLDRFAGHEVKSTGDGFLAIFDRPARAIRCALSVRDDSRPLGILVRAGIHTGELERRGEDVGGIAVDIGSRVAGVAQADEVLVSSTVKDLVAGSRLEFADRGEHALTGVAGNWHLFGVIG